jgi:DNA-binding XRE family transcriptional regulator
MAHRLAPCPRCRLHLVPAVPPPPAPPRSRLPPLSNRLWHYRHQLGWSQRQLARALGITHHRLGRIERQEVPLTVDLLARCSRVLNLPALLLVPALGDPVGWASNDYPPTPGGCPCALPLTT